MHRTLIKGLIVCLSATGWASLRGEDCDDRARQLVSKMTLEEKLSELHGIQDDSHFRYVPPLKRLGIPPFRIANGPAGVGPAGDVPQKPATAMPAPIALASTWDLELANKYGVVIGQESRDLDEDLLEAPDVNIARVPQNGRTFEAFGEDPFLASRMAVSEIQGIQNQGVIANVKHFAANNQESSRSRINAIIDERALEEIYFPAFENSVTEGHVASVMAAYNKVNGVYCCENTFLLKDVLKKDWNFKGFVTSDFGAVHSTVHSALAGLDLEMPTGKYFGTNLQFAVETGHVPISIIDDKLVRRFSIMMRFGLFDHMEKPRPIPARKDGLVARMIAENGMVLLKNDRNELPLIPDRIRQIAIIGPYAVRAMSGGGGSSHVVPLYTVAPVDGIRQRLGSRSKIEFDDGQDVSRAQSLARISDVAVVMVGDADTEGRDHSLTLDGNQDALIMAIAAANPNTIVVLKTGSAIFMPWLDHVAAVLEAWYPGEEDGNALAAVLFGEINPSGRLPITFPRNLTDLPANTKSQYPGMNGAANYLEGVFVGYRSYDAKGIQPLFPFGYGLSYTTFSCKNLAITPETLAANIHSGESVGLDLKVSNTGKRFGETVVQVYVGFPSAREIPQPPEQLKGFSKVALDAGQSRNVRIHLDMRSFAYWNTDAHEWSILPGDYKIMVGFSSRDIQLQKVVCFK